MNLAELMKSLSNPNELNKLSKYWVETYKRFLYKKGLSYIQRSNNYDLKFIVQHYDKKLLLDWFLTPLVANKLLNSQCNNETTKYILSRFVEVLSHNKLIDETVFKNEDLTSIHSLPVDIGNGLLFEQMAEQYGKLTSPSDITSITRKLDIALSKLKMKHNDVYEFITSCNFFLALRDDSHNASSYSSGSYNGYPGFTILTNINQERITEARIIDSLYHEAIHTMIYMYEEVNGKLLKKDYDREIKLVSPWTGSPLGLNQFAQAIFVWKGLLFLNDSLEGTGLNYTSSRAKAGFLHDPARTFLKEGGYNHAYEKTIDLFENFYVSI